MIDKMNLESGAIPRRLFNAENIKNINSAQYSLRPKKTPHNGALNLSHSWSIFIAVGLLMTRVRQERFLAFKTRLNRILNYGFTESPALTQNQQHRNQEERHKEGY